MGFWDKLFGKKSEVKSTASAVSLREIITGEASASNSGEFVDHATALQVSAVCACVDVIARGVAQIPFRLMRKNERTRIPAEEKELFWLIARGPNPYMTDYEFRYTIAQHAALTGNAYVWLNRVMGKIKEMYPLQPGCVVVLNNDKKNDGWSKKYVVTMNNGSTVTIPEEDMWVIKWRTFDGLFGLDPVRLAREAIGLSLSGEKMAANIYKKGTSINGYLSTEGNLSEEAREILRSEWAKNFSGSKNAGSVAVLTANLKYTPIQRMTAQEAQLIDNRNFQISEICRMFGVQPIMVYHYLNATTYASVEQMFLSHIVHTMTPWYRLIESSANKHLLSEQEFTSGYYFKFFEQGMLRGDMAAMANWFKSNIEHGIMSPNDCRELMDMNPYEEGDIYLVPLNMATPKQVKEQAELNKKKILNDIAIDKEQSAIAKEQLDLAKQTNQADPSSSEGDDTSSSPAKNTDGEDSLKKKEKE